MTKIDWEAKYPDGFLTCWSSRRFAKVNHKRLKMLAAYEGATLEEMFDRVVTAGLQVVELEVFAREEV